MDEVVSSPVKPQADKVGSITALVLTAIARDSRISQRRLASEIGIAVGLANAYVKRCVRKGYLKVQAVPQRRYTYYLTPKGFTEKSRLTAEYLSASLGFFRRARHECTGVISFVLARGWTRLALIGTGDLCEIAVLCALEQGVKIVAIVDADRAGNTLAGVRIVATLDDLPEPVDAYIFTAIKPMGNLVADLAKEISPGRLLAPQMLGLSELDQPGEGAV